MYFSPFLSWLPNINKNTSDHKNSLIIEDGAMRSVFSAGVLDGFILNNFNPFDFYLGVSAGAHNLVSYTTGIPGLSIKIYLDYALKKEFINYKRFLFGGHLLDLDWLADVIYKKLELRLYSSKKFTKPLYVCVTNTLTGQAKYIKATKNNIQQLTKASSSLPLLYRNFPEVDGIKMTDGGIAQAIPISKAIKMGAKKIMLIRACQKSYIKKDTLGHKFIRWNLRHYPALRMTAENRILIHNKSLDTIQHPPNGVKIIEICPPCEFKLNRFSKNKAQLQQGYQFGLNASKEGIKRWLSL